MVPVARFKLYSNWICTEYATLGLLVPAETVHGSPYLCNAYIIKINVFVNFEFSKHCFPQYSISKEFTLVHMIIKFKISDLFLCSAGEHSVARTEAHTYCCRENEILKFTHRPVGQP